MTPRIRREIELHFSNYIYDAAEYDERVTDICYAGSVVNVSHIGSRNKASRPTENKALKLFELSQRRNWTAVVRETFAAFRLEYEYYIMLALYIDRIPWKKLIEREEIPPASFWRWRDRWLEHAYQLAKTYQLLT